MAQQFWVRAGNEKSHGPFTTTQLRKLAANNKLKPEHSVSTDQKHWVEASRVKGLTFRAPEPTTLEVDPAETPAQDDPLLDKTSGNPYEAPSTPSNDLDERTNNRLLNIARAYQFASIVMYVALFLTIASRVAGQWDWVALPLQLVASVLQVVATLRLGRFVFSSVVQAVLRVFLASMPCVGLLALLTAKTSAGEELRKHGYDVGLFWTDLDQFAK